jgi:hypothetical protein
MSTKKEYGKDRRFVINMATGSHGFRTEITDTLPVTFKIISDATCDALCKGKVKGSEVVAAIKKGFMSKPDFDWEEYDRRRQIEKQHMNVSQHDMVPVGDETEVVDEPKSTLEVYTLEGLGLADSSVETKKGSKKLTQAKVEKTETPSSAIADALGEY